MYGVSSQELIDACKQVGQKCNDFASKYIDEGKFEIGLEYLKRGQNVTSSDPEGLQLTFNTMATLYKHKGDLKLALRYLMLALDEESNIADENKVRRSNIHLNICAVTSQLGRHKTALKQAKLAINLLESTLILRRRSYVSEHNNSSRGLGLIKEDDNVFLDVHDDDDETVGTGISYDFDFIESDTDIDRSKQIATLAISYYNAGAEHEHLKEFSLSYHCYQRGLKALSHHFCESHILVKTLKQSSQAVVKKIVKINIL